MDTYATWQLKTIWNELPNLLWILAFKVFVLGFWRPYLYHKKTKTKTKKLYELLESKVTTLLLEGIG